MIFNILKRCWVLHCLLFLIAVFGVDYHRTAIRTVDQLNTMPAIVSTFAQKEGSYIDAMLAIHYYKNLATLVPDASTAYGAIGFCYYHMKKYPKAVKYYKKAIKGKKVFLGFYYNLGMAYYRQGNFKRAMESFQQALKVDPFDTLSYPNIVFPSRTSISGTATAADLKKGRLLQLKIGYRNASRMVTLSRSALKDSPKKDTLEQNELLKNLYYYPPFRIISIKGRRKRIFM